MMQLTSKLSELADEPVLRLCEPGSRRVLRNVVSRNQAI
jgi:hypothetical protein